MAGELIKPPTAWPMAAAGSIGSAASKRELVDESWSIGMAFKLEEELALMGTLCAKARGATDCDVGETNANDEVTKDATRSRNVAFIVELPIMLTLSCKLMCTGETQKSAHEIICQLTSVTQIKILRSLHRRMWYWSKLKINFKAIASHKSNRRGMQF